MQPNGTIFIAMGDKIIYEKLFGYVDIEEKNQHHFKHNILLVRLQSNLQQ
jgi:hypothetical protein